MAYQVSNLKYCIYMYDVLYVSILSIFDIIGTSEFLKNYYYDNKFRLKIE
jgi:hypothetical protein